MRTHPILALVAVLATASPSLAAPAVCQGRFTVDGSPLDLGVGAEQIASLTNSARISLAGEAGGFSVRLDQACSSVAVVQVPRADQYVVRARFVDCGDRPRFRIRLAFDAACERVVGRIRAAGQLVGEFTARRARLVTPPVDDGSDPMSVPVVDPMDDPMDDAPPAAPVETPLITVFAPSAAASGETITLFGQHLDRDADGTPWTGTPPYVVRFQHRNGERPANATFTFVSDTELRVTVPATADGGPISLLRRGRFGGGLTISSTEERFIVVVEDTTRPPAPVAGTPPATTNDGRLTIQGSGLDALTPGVFALDGRQNQVGAFVDLNGNGIVDLVGGRADVPYLAFPVRTSDFDFTVEQGRGYFAGADTVLWVFFGNGDAVLDNRDVFVAVHLDVNITTGTARPVAMIAGVAGSPGIVISTDGFTEAAIVVESPVLGGPGALRGHLAAVPNFLELIFLPSQPLPDGTDLGPSFEQRLWANGIVLDFDVPLFNDAQ